MRIYIAGKYQEREYVRRLMDKLEKMGHTITCDWTDQILYPPDKITSRNAIDDINGIRECDVYIGVFINKHNYRGAFVEMGAALMAGKPTYILGSTEESMVFMWHPLVGMFDTEGELLEALSR